MFSLLFQTCAALLFTSVLLFLRILHLVMGCMLVLASLPLSAAANLANYKLNCINALLAWLKLLNYNLAFGFDFYFNEDNTFVMAI